FSRDWSSDVCSSDLIEVRLFEDATIFSISYNNFQQILEVSNYGEKITRLAVETVFIEKQQQQIDLLTKTAKERYIELMQDKNGRSEERRVGKETRTR